MKRYIIEVEAQMVDNRVSDTAQGINRLLAINGKSSVLTERERDDSVSFAERHIAVCINIPKNSLAVKVYEREFTTHPLFRLCLIKLKKKLSLKITLFTHPNATVMSMVCVLMTVGSVWISQL